MSTAKHLKFVPGFDGSLTDLAECVHDMTYDQVSEFYGSCAAKLKKDSTADRERGRIQLAVLLAEAAENSKRQQQLFEQIWTLCEPHMR